MMRISSFPPAKAHTEINPPPTLVQDDLFRPHKFAAVSKYNYSKTPCLNTHVIYKACQNFANKRKKAKLTRPVTGQRWPQKVAPGSVCISRHRASQKFNEKVIEMCRLKGLFCSKLYFQCDTTKHHNPPTRLLSHQLLLYKLYAVISIICQ